MNEAIDLQSEIIKQIAPGLVERSIEGYAQWLVIWQVAAAVSLAVLVTALAAALRLIWKNNHIKNEDGTFRAVSEYDKEDMFDHTVLLFIVIIAAFVLVASIMGAAVCIDQSNCYANSPIESVLKHEFASYR